MTTIDRSIDGLAVSWSHRTRWRPVALIAVGLVVLFLEVAPGQLDHGTHLLVALATVVLIAVLLGPRPGIGCLSVGAGVAGLASVIGQEGPLPHPGAFVQLAAYLVLGGATIALLATAVRVRALELPAQASASRRLGDAAPLPWPPEPMMPVEVPTSRELEVLRAAATGSPVEEIARRLSVSPNTVKTHLTHVYGKLGAQGRTEAVRAAMHAGWLTPRDICPHRFGDAESESPVPMTTGGGPRPTI